MGLEGSVAKLPISSDASTGATLGIISTSFLCGVPVVCIYSSNFPALIRLSILFLDLSETL